MAVTFVDITNDHAFGTSSTVAIPAGAQVGDLLIAVHAIGSSSENPTFSTGWTVLHTVNDRTGLGARVLYKFMESGEPSFEVTNSTSRNNSVIIAAYRGVDATTPFLGSNATSNSTTTTHVGTLLSVSGDFYEVGIATDHEPGVNPTNTGWTVDAALTMRGEIFHAQNGTFASSAVLADYGAERNDTSIPARTFTSTIDAVGAVFSIALVPDGFSPTPSLVSRWTGAVTSDGATVATKTAYTSSVRLKVATDSALTTGVTYSSPATPDVNGRAKLSVSGLAEDTQYYYGVEVDGTVDTAQQGKFKTLPSVGSQASFSFAFGSCWASNQDTDAATRIEARDPLLFIQCGDFHYDDNSTNNQDLFRASIDQQLALPTIGSLLANVPSPYVWSDHDYGGNNSNGSAASKPAAQAVYRQIVPHHTLAVADSIEHTFVVGRVRFILTDERSFKSAQADTDDSSKTMLGTTQKTWFKNLIDTCDEQVIFWVGDTPWTGSVVAGDDHWASYDTERQELAAHIVASGKTVIRLGGDMHALAADDGTNSAGGIPVFQAAALNRNSSYKGGPYSEGRYPTTTGVAVRQYGYVSVTDTGGDTITVDFAGYDTSDVAQITLQVVATIPPSELPAPTGLTATAVSSDQIDLSWDAYPGAASYDIERDGLVIVSEHATNSYSDTGLTPETLYTYRVRAQVP